MLAQLTLPMCGGSADLDHSCALALSQPLMIQLTHAPTELLVSRLALLTSAAHASKCDGSSMLLCLLRAVLTSRWLYIAATWPQPGWQGALGREALPMRWAAAA